MNVISENTPAVEKAYLVVTPEILRDRCERRHGAKQSHSMQYSHL
ncbi:hypothetical protein [Algoriphagus confluentis]